MTLRERIEDLRAELRALGVALGDPRTPIHAKAVAGVTLGLAASPIDPIPDFVPVLGYVDDAIFIPVGLYLAHRTIPDEVLSEARETADRDPETASRRLLGLALVLLGWTVAGLVAAWIAMHLLGVTA